MTKLLIQGATILAQDVTEHADEIRSADAIYPKHVIEGWRIVEVDVPEGFTPAGFTWGGVMVVEKPPVVVPPEVPQVVTMRQARLALFQAGLLDQVDAIIDAMTDPIQQKAARIEWEYSQEVHRNKALVQTLAPALGLDGAATDQLFITAATL